MHVLIAHDGRSVQSLNGRQYNFYFGLRPEDTPFYWGASYDIPSGSLDQEKPSPQAIYTLTTLLQLPPTSDPSVLFARPGADKVVLYVRREPQPGTLNAQITQLKLAVKVDFFRRNASLVTMSVQSGDLQPYIVIDKTDVTNRTDGSGTFQRTYYSGDRVTLSAEPFHGNLKFKYWSDDLGNVLGSSPTLIITLTSTASVHPVYTSLLSPLYFTPVTPCRVVDSRSGQGTTGEYGPPLLRGGETRAFHIAAGRCSGIPATAQAYSVNVTVVPSGNLGYLSMWPSDQAQPLVSTLNAPKGGIVANAAIVPAAASGAVSVFVTDPTDVVLDINGYFDSTPSTSSSVFYTVAPCRIVDTRNGPSAAGRGCLLVRAVISPLVPVPVYLRV